MAWRFGLCDLAGVPIGELHNAYDRKLTLPLNGLPTASFRIRLDNPMAEEISSRDGDCLVKVYQDSTLRFIGDITTSEEVADGEKASLAVTAAGPLWRLQKRLIGTPYPSTFSWTDVAADQIIKAILDQANLDDGALNRDTGIRWNGSNPTLYVATVGVDPSWLLKPVATAYADLQEAKVPFPVATPPYYDAQDNFTQAGNPFLHGQTATDGSVWDTNDTAVTDFDIVSASDYAHRGPAAGDPSYATGKWAVSGSGNHAAVVVGIDYQFGTATYAAGYSYYAGVFARYQDQNNWLLAVLDLQANAIILRKNVAGVGVGSAFEIFNFTVGGVTHSTRYAIRLLVDDVGNYTVWHYAPPDTPRAPVIQGRHPDLATGGALATGKVGFYDALTTGVGFDRNYYTFFAADDPTPQSFDFEIAPTEPTTDADGLQIGTLNLSYVIGTSKPEVIFEYGTGNRTIKSYRRITDRQGLVNHAYVLHTESDGFIDVRGSDDPTSIAARGEFQELLPEDFGDSQLRQAWADVNVAVRKVPRQLITFEPTANAPEFGTDYIVGDVITGRAVVNGDVRFNAEFRVWAVEITLDDEGKETVVPTLAPE